MAVPTLLTVAELKSKLGGPVVVDGSWHMPAAKRDPIKEFREDGHIPGGKKGRLTMVNGNELSEDMKGRASQIDRVVLSIFLNSQIL